MKISNLQFAIVLGTAVALSSVATAQQLKPPQIVGVRVGIANRYKAGLWTQVEVTLRGGSEMLTGELSVIVPDGDGVPGCSTTPPGRPCLVLPGQDTTVPLITRFGHVDGELTAEFRVAGRLLARETFRTSLQADGEHFLPALENRELIVVVGDSTLGIEETGKLSGTEADYRPVAARIGDVEQLPTNWCAYEGVGAVVLSTSRPEIYRKLTADNARVQALDQWVRMGGRLVLCVGSQADQVLAAGLPLAQFAPGRLEKMVSLRQTGALETYCGSRAGVNQADGRKAEMRIPRLAGLTGTVEAREADVPLVIRTVRGFGQVIFLAGDLDRAPLSGWKDRPLLVARLLDMPTAAAEESKENAGVMHYGYGDLSGQMRSALDRFTGVRLVPFWLVAGLIVVYILLIGPGDYFFLRKVVGRMEWTWLTFPTIVVVVSVAAYVLDYQLKGNQLRVNQLDLVDVDAASGRLRGATWLNVFSPRMESFNFTVRPRRLDSGEEEALGATAGSSSSDRSTGGQAGARASGATAGSSSSAYDTGGQAARGTRVWMAWLGLSGEALGGMNSHATGLFLWTEQFRYASNLDALLGVPIQVQSTKSLTARWEAPVTACPAAELAEAEQLLSGTITNTLPFPLRECMLVHGRSAYQLNERGTLAPGESARLGPMSKRSELKTWLTGWKTVFNETDKYHQEATPYDPSSTDLPYILRAMMFYEAAGGRHYTGLWNDYQQFVDLSNLLKADRAILVAQGPASEDESPQGDAALLRFSKEPRDGNPLGGPQDQHRKMYRFIFPVKTSPQ